MDLYKKTIYNEVHNVKEPNHAIILICYGMSPLVGISAYFIIQGNQTKSKKQYWGSNIFL